MHRLLGERMSGWKTAERLEPASAPRSKSSFDARAQFQSSSTGPARINQGRGFPALLNVQKQTDLRNSRSHVRAQRETIPGLCHINSGFHILAKGAETPTEPRFCYWELWKMSLIMWKKHPYRYPIMCFDIRGEATGKILQNQASNENLLCFTFYLIWNHGFW